MLRRLKRAHLVLFVAFVVLRPVPSRGHGPYAVSDRPSASESRVPCVPPEILEMLTRAAPKSPDARRLTAPPLYAWPVEKPLNDELVLINYVDDDTTVGIADYMGLPHSYNGHQGTDLGLLDFRAMDHGCHVLSGAPGTVISTWYSDTDRSVGPPFAGAGNYVLIDNGDNTTTMYHHFRRNAVTVEEGEVVQTGQSLGLIGSSGPSYDPHLHFQVDSWNPQTFRDPWTGPNNPLPSLWLSQEPYVGDDTLHLLDMGISTQSAAGGDVTGIPQGLFKERLAQPVVMGADEPYVVLWFQAQSAGLTCRVQIRRPDNSVFAGQFAGLSKTQRGWFYFFWDFAGNVSPAEYGVWTAQFRIGTTLIKSVPFVVDATTRFGPRFWPVAGRSFRINGNVQRDTLRVSSLGGPVTYELLDAPGFVSLVDDSIVTIGALSSQSQRSAYFQAIATDAIALRDTMWYHLVDPTKPPEAEVGVPPTFASGAPTSIQLSESAPNPFREATTVRYAVPREAPATLRVYDAGGRLVATLLERGRADEGDGGVASWDGRTASGEPAPSGVYFLRLESGRDRQSRKAILVR
jgi:Peptidase family M23/FlgD Ig-like domain